MSNQPKIRWKPSDVKTLKSIQRGVANEVKRIAKEKPELSHLQPEIVDFNKLKKSFETRKQYNAYINSMMSYIRIGGDEIVTGAKGATFLKWDVEETRLQTRAFNAMQTKKAKELGVSVEKGTGGVIEQQNLRKKKFSVDKTEKEWNLFKKNLEQRLQREDQQEKAEKFFNDYKDSVTNFLGEEGDKIIDYLDSKVTDFVDFFDKSFGDPVLNIQQTSDPLPITELVEKIYTRWKTVYR